MAPYYRVNTIFLGGGTPSYISEACIEKLLDTVRGVFDVDRDCEITLEGNPDSLTADKLRVYRQAGVNRLSIGLQSLHDDLLRRLGRIHDRSQFLKAYEQARKAGFTNINVDLMSGLPGGSGKAYLQTLEGVLALKPEHISAYSLIVEEGTPLAEDAALLEQLPGEEEDRWQYRKTKELLLTHGYKRYEISNYAREGFACRHNMVYWTMGEYLGLGLGASSFLRLAPEAAAKEEKRACAADRELWQPGSIRTSLTDVSRERREAETPVRFHGEQELAAYLKCYGGEAEGCLLPGQMIRSRYRDVTVLEREDEMEEFMFLGLRMTDGISGRTFRRRFGQELEAVYGDVLHRYLENGLLVQKGDRLFLSDRGLDVSNVVMADFLL